MSQHTYSARQADRVEGKGGLSSKDSSKRSSFSEDVVPFRHNIFDRPRDRSPGSLQSDDGLVDPKELSTRSQLMKSLKAAQRRPATRLWTPLPLKSVILFGFIALFAILLLALEALFQIDGRRDGLSEAKGREHYLWAYGPTAVFIIVAACWGPVDYWTKQLTPWKSLKDGYGENEQPMLLDYVSMWSIKALYVSLRKAHVPVSLAVTVSMLTKLLVILSTGLLVLQVSMSESDVSMQFANRFDVGKFNISLVDPLPALIVVGAHRLGLDLPHGTTLSHAVQMFSLPDLTMPSIPTAVLTATVDTFSADLTCEDARLTNSYPTCADATCTAVFFSVDVASASCLVSKAGPLSFATTASKNQTFGSVFNVRCDELDGSEAGRLLIITGSRIPNSGTNATIENPVSGKLNGDFSSVLCKPSFQTQKRTVALNANGTINAAMSDFGSNRGINTTSLSNIAAQDIGTVVKNSVDAAVEQLRSYNDQLSSELGQNAPKIDTTNTTLHGFSWTDPTAADYDGFFLLLNATSPQPDPAAFMDRKFLASTARSVFQLMAAQVAERHLTTADQSPVQGNMVTVEHRLHIRPIGLRLMESILALLIILVALLWKTRPTAVTPRDTSTLAGLSAVLARSPHVNAFFTGLSKLDGKSLHDTVTGHHYRSLVRHDPAGNLMSFGLEHHALRYGGIRASIAPPPLMAQQPIWRPLSLRLPVLLVILIVPIGGIVALELLLRKSQKQNGLGIVELEGYMKYFWAFIPAAFMLAVRQMFGMIDYAVRVLAPFQQLKKRPTSATESIELNYLSLLPVASLLKAIRSRHYAVIATTIMMFLVPFMLIVDSALFFPRSAGTVPTTVDLLNVVNASFSENTTTSNRQISLLADLVLGAGVSSPKWTYDEFVMPALYKPSIKSTRKNERFSVNDEGVMKLRMPVLRANLNCTYVSDTYRNDQKSISATFPSECTIDGSSKNSTEFNLTLAANTSYYGQFFDAPLGDSGTNSNGCPSKSGVFGTLVSGDNSTGPGKVEGLHAFYCYPSVSELQADIILSLPDFSILSTSADESTAKQVADQTSTFSVATLFNLSSTIQPNVSLDGFFQAATQNSNLTSLLGDSTWPALNTALEHAYRITFAQRANLVARTPATTTAETFPATVSYATSNRAHLIQDEASTRALEALIGIMILLAITAWFFVDTRIVPAEPTSIAAMTALLANSVLLSEGTIPSGSEYIRGKLFDGFLFSIGWWVRRSDGARRYGVDIGRADELGPDPVTRRISL